MEAAAEGASVLTFDEVAAGAVLDGRAGAGKASCRKSPSDGTRGIPAAATAVTTSGRDEPTVGAVEVDAAGCDEDAICWAACELSATAAARLVVLGIRFKNSWNAASESVRPIPPCPSPRQKPPNRSSTLVCRSILIMLLARLSNASLQVLGNWEADVVLTGRAWAGFRG